MAKSIKVHITYIPKDVTILRLTTSEIKERFYDPDTSVSIVIPELKEEEIVYSEISDDYVLCEDDSIFYIETARTVEVLYGCVADFADKVLPSLASLPDDKLAISVEDLYRNCVLINPVLDRMTSAIFSSSDPLDSSMDRLTDLLPDPLGKAITEYMYVSSFIDDAYDAYEEKAAAGLSYDVEETALSLERAPELDIDVAKVRLLRQELMAQVVGQRYAIDHVVAVSKRIAAGFRDSSRPPAVLLFVGPTGVGKTLLAKVTAQTLFSRADAFGRIDCATLSERHDVSKLFGPPPGYVGYPSDRSGDPKDSDPSVLWRETRGFESGGILLLDEVEKAHPDVWDAFLTIMDEGYAKTSVGNTIDFRNTVIIMTSNLGTKEMSRSRNKAPLGFSSALSMLTPTDAKQIKKVALGAAKNYLKPELLGRITAVVPFTDLSHEEMLAVVDLEWAKDLEYIKESIESTITIDDSIKNRIAHLSSDKGSGARLVSRLLEGYVIDPLAELHVEKPTTFTKKGTSAIVSFKGNNGACDEVEVSVDGVDSLTYEVSMTLGDD